MKELRSDISVLHIWKWINLIMFFLVFQDFGMRVKGENSFQDIYTEDGNFRLHNWTLSDKGFSYENITETTNNTCKDGGIKMMTILSALANTTFTKVIPRDACDDNQCVIFLRVYFTINGNQTYNRIQEFKIRVKGRQLSTQSFLDIMQYLSEDQISLEWFRCAENTAILQEKMRKTEKHILPIFSKSKALNIREFEQLKARFQERLKNPEKKESWEWSEHVLEFIAICFAVLVSILLYLKICLAKRFNATAREEAKKEGRKEPSYFGESKDYSPLMMGLSAAATCPQYQMRAKDHGLDIPTSRFLVPNTVRKNSWRHGFHAFEAKNSSALVQLPHPISLIPNLASSPAFNNTAVNVPLATSSSDSAVSSFKTVPRIVIPEDIYD